MRPNWKSGLINIANQFKVLPFENISEICISFRRMHLVKNRLQMIEHFDFGYVVNFCGKRLVVKAKGKSGTTHLPILGSWSRFNKTRISIYHSKISQEFLNNPTLLFLIVRVKQTHPFTRNNNSIPICCRLFSQNGHLKGPLPHCKRRRDGGGVDVTVNKGN